MQMAMDLSTLGTMSLGATTMAIRTPFPERAQAMRRTYRTGARSGTELYGYISGRNSFQLIATTKKASQLNRNGRLKQAPRCAKNCARSDVFCQLSPHLSDLLPVTLSGLRGCTTIVDFRRSSEDLHLRIVTFPDRRPGISPFNDRK